MSRRKKPRLRLPVSRLTWKASRLISGPAKATASAPRKRPFIVPPVRVRQRPAGRRGDDGTTAVTATSIGGTGPYQACPSDAAWYQVASASNGGRWPWASTGWLAAPSWIADVLLHRLEDVPADRLTGVEVGELEVGVLRAELLAELVLGGAGEVAELAHQAACLAGVLGQLVGAEDDHGDEGDDHQLRYPDPEHVSA